MPFQNGFFIAGRIRSRFIRMRVFDLRAWQHTRHLLSMYRSTRPEVADEIREFIGESKRDFLPGTAGK